MDYSPTRTSLLTIPTDADRGGEVVMPAPSGAGGVPAWAEASTCTSGKIAFSRSSDDDALARSWERLEAAALLPTQSHAFAASLSSTLLAEADVEVFFAAGADGIVALLPLCREKRRFARWRMLGARELFEPGDALCHDSEAARRLAKAIAREARALDLERLPAGSPLIPALRAAMRGKGWTSVRPDLPCPTIALNDGWKDPEHCFNAGRRSDFRRAARRASTYGRLSFEMLSPRPDDFDALFDEAAAVEARGWKSEAGTAIAADPGKARFFRTFFHSACEQGAFRIAFMRIDGQAVAMQMALESLDRYWLFKIGFDEKFGRCSPGTLLMLHTLSWAAKRGLAAYELLGDVEPWIAQLWTREQHDCVRLRTYPFNARGAVAFAADAIAWLRSRLKRAAG